MKASVVCSAVLLTLLSGVTHCGGANILVFSIEGSHWINMEIILKELHSRGHNLTVLRSSQSWYIKEDSDYYTTINVPMDESIISEKGITELGAQIIEYERGTLPWSSFLQLTVGMFGTVVSFHQNVCSFVSTILDNKEIVSTMKASNFDLMLADPAWGVGAIVAKYLNIPVVYNVRWLVLRDAHFAIAPSPISYIPVTGTGFTDKMTFLQRVKNMILHLISQTQNSLLIRQTYQPLCEKYFGPDSDFNSVVLDADIWLMRVDFVFDFPRPTMPNVVYMGGFQCKPAKPLPSHLEDFVQSSGEHGVILMSMGTFLNKLPDDLMDQIAATFAKLPQKVIWKHKGRRPATLGNNTLLVDWMPQNDILGHPKTRLFVAHGGTNGIQEALYHGIPVVGIPGFFDQHDNLIRLKARGGAEILSFATVNGETLFKSIQKVLSDQSYTDNMQRLARLHRDKPMHPLDHAIFWIEFVIRYKGADHLKSESYRMSWFHYFSIDVALLLMGISGFVMITTVLFIRCIFRRMFKKKSKQE